MKFDDIVLALPKPGLKIGGWLQTTNSRMTYPWAGTNDNPE